MKYYYLDLQNKTAGPVTLDELSVLIKNGAINNNPMVVVEGGTQWQPLSTVLLSSNALNTKALSGANNRLIYAVLGVGMIIGLYFIFLKPGTNGSPLNVQQTRMSETRLATVADQSKNFFSKRVGESAVVADTHEPVVSEKDQVLNGLRQIDAAINQYALEKGKRNGDIVTWDDVNPYLLNGEQLRHPGDGYYILHPIGEPPTSSKYGNLMQ
jgi:hypothetical protein